MSSSRPADLEFGGEFFLGVGGLEPNDPSDESLLIPLDVGLGDSDDLVSSGL